MTSTRKLQRVITATLMIATAALSLVAGSTPASAEGSLSYSFETMFNATNTAIDLRSVDGLKGTYDATCSWCLLEFGPVDEAGFVGYKLSGGKITKQTIVYDRVASNDWLVFDVRLTAADLVATKAGKTRREVKGGDHVGYEFALRSTAKDTWVVVAGQRGTLKF